MISRIKFTATKGVKLGKRIHLLSGIALTGLFYAFFTLAIARSASAAEPKTTLAISIRTLSSPYQVMYKVGAEAFAKKVDLPLDVLTTEANSQKGLTDIKAEVARTGGNVAFFIDPNDASDALPIAKALEAAGVDFVTWWSKPSEVKAWDYPHWVAHISFDGLAAGTYTATELLRTFKTPGQGKIIALQGRLGDTPNAERWEGLHQVLAKNPEVKLLQWESAQWDRTQAYNDTKAMLVAHPDIDGVWTANDDMAMGAIQALKDAGLAGKVLVTGCDGIPEMFDAIKGGLAAATILNDGKYQAQLGLAMALAAKEGKLDVKSLPHKNRQFEIPAVNVNRDNVNQVVHDYLDTTPTYDLSNFFAQWSTAIP
ncbi:MAG: sugar ABC transporter substrate-binding protein [Verrucomicrobia bacterium]|nr:sugar ABC transporter substrate-binding protein [Verrucomicrobiota bacterium]